MGYSAYVVRLKQTYVSEGTIASIFMFRSISQVPNQRETNRKQTSENGDEKFIRYVF